MSIDNNIFMMQKKNFHDIKFTDQLTKKDLANILGHVVNRHGTKHHKDNQSHEPKLPCTDYPSWKWKPDTRVFHGCKFNPVFSNTVHGQKLQTHGQFITRPIGWKRWQYPMGKSIWVKWADGHNTAQPEVYTIPFNFEKRQSIQRRYAFRKVCIPLVRDWTWSYGSNGLIPMTLPSYISRQFHRTSNRENPFSSLQWRHNGRDGCSIHQAHSTVYSGTDERKHQSSASLAAVWGTHRWPANSTCKEPVTRKMFPFDDVIMSFSDKFSAKSELPARTSTRL